MKPSPMRRLSGMPVSVILTLLLLAFRVLLACFPKGSVGGQSAPQILLSISLLSA